MALQTDKTNEIFDYMRKLFGEEPACELDYKTSVDLLVAIILSAQCTDKRVNLVSKDLYEKYKTINDYANAKQDELEQIIHSCGFYHNKASNIIKMAKTVVENFEGVIPANIDELIKLPGVGRKTANVFLAELYKQPAIAVDTHVIRVSGRLGLTKSQNPEIIERDLAKLIDKKNWRLVNLYLVLFGRYYCKAIKPMCDECSIKKHCLHCKRAV